jgi:hypothetical protein
MAASGAETEAEQRAMNDLVALAAERNVLEQERAALIAKANENMGFLNQAELDALNARIAGNLELSKQREAALGVAAAERDAAEAAEAHERAIENAYGVYAKTRGEGEMLAEAAERAGMSAEALASITFGNIAQAVVYANNLADAMARASLNYGKIQNTGQSGPDAARRSVMELNAPGLLTGTVASGAGGVWTPPAGSGGGGGGGGGGGRSAAAAEAEREAQAIQKVVDGLKAEIEQVGASQEARRLHQELQKAGVTIYSEEGQQIAALVEELTQLEAKQKLVAETMRGIENAAQGFFVGVLSGAKDLESALGDLLRQLGNLFLNQAFQMLWNGKGGGGGIGGWLQDLFFDAGGHIPAGALGVVAEKRPEFVDRKLVTSPTLVRGPANVTGGAATGRMLDRAPEMQVAMRRPAQSMLQPKVNVAPAAVRVVVLDDPSKIDAYLRSPEGEKTQTWAQGRRRNG